VHSRSVSCADPYFGMSTRKFAAPQPHAVCAAAEPLTRVARAKVSPDSAGQFCPDLSWAPWMRRCARTFRQQSRSSAVT
jgi:hypothetical protein